MIYAPIIDSKIPAFTDILIKVPFELNPAVSQNEIKAYGLWVKEINTGSTVIKAYNAISISNIDNYILTIELSALSGFISNLYPGVFYKIQIAFLDESDWNNGTPDETNIRFSDAAVGRCIIAPQVTINSWDNSSIQQDTGMYQGKTIQETPSETVGEYRFQVVELTTGNIIQDTGWLIHNSKNDDVVDSVRTTIDTFELLYELGNVLYKIIYYIKTNNGYETQVENYITGNSSIITLDWLNFTALHENNVQAYDNGFVALKITKATNDKPIAGKYKIRRWSANKLMWENIFSFELEDYIYDTTQTMWLDTTIEQGEIYKYKLVQYLDTDDTMPDNNFAETDSVTIMADFEAVFLSDNERQLCIKYNPKVSSFKETLQDAKQDTLGGQYPFFFRNGNLRYKEIPLNGLLSYQIDENEMFIAKEKLGLNDDNKSTTDLVGYNVTAERKFKLAVLEWLNNGKPKLFRSPTEGNYVVRLMNVSLSPNDTLGRMIHSFTATGYEVAATDYASLIKHKLIFTNREVIDNVESKFIE